MINVQRPRNGWPSTQTSLAHLAKVSLTTVTVLDLIVSCCMCQLQAGVYDFGFGFHGEKRGSWTPSEWLACVLLIMTILMGLAISIGLCYYVNRNQAQKAASRANYLKRQNLQFASLELKRQPLSSGRQSSLSLERVDDLEQQVQGDRELANNSLAYQDYYNDNQRRQGRQQQPQRQTPDPSLVVQI